MLTSYDGRTITYDAIGNPLSDGIWNYTWEQGRRLTRMQSSSASWNYTYDTSGLRTQRSNGTTTYRYWYNDNGLLLRMEKGSTVYSFTYDPAGHPVSVTEGSNRYYYVLNQQGDVVAIINGNGDFVVEYYYDAWGRLISTSGTMSSTLGVNNPLRYRGYIYDHETGLYYLQSRYYNPTWGRFINADDPGYMGVDGTPSSYNLFSYCGNNPVTREDSEGEFWLAIGIGFIAGLVTQYINDVAENIADGKTGFAIFEPKSEISDYVASGIGGAIGSIPGLGFWGSMAAGSVGNVFTEYMKGNINSWGDLGSVALDGVLASGFGEGVTKGMSFIKVKQIGKMPRMSRKSFLRDKLFCNAQSSVNANLRTFVGNSLRTNMNLVEDQLPIFRSGIYSTAASSLWSLF